MDHPVNSCGGGGGCCHGRSGSGDGDGGGLGFVLLSCGVNGERGWRECEQLTSGCADRGYIH